LQISRGKPGVLHRAPAGFTVLALDGYGLCDLLPARPTSPASYPISVRQVATLLHASFRRSLAVPPLRFASASPPSGCTGDLHPQDAGHARHTGRFAPLARWPEDGPSLTAAARAGVSRAQVGTEGWLRSNKRMARGARGASRHILMGFPPPLPPRCRQIWKRKRAAGAMSPPTVAVFPADCRACSVSDRRGDNLCRTCRGGRRR